MGFIKVDNIVMNEDHFRNQYEVYKALANYNLPYVQCLESISLGEGNFYFLRMENGLTIRANVYNPYIEVFKSRVEDEGYEFVENSAIAEQLLERIVETSFEGYVHIPTMEIFPKEDESIDEVTGFGEKAKMLLDVPYDKSIGYLDNGKILIWTWDVEAEPIRVDYNFKEDVYWLDKGKPIKGIKKVIRKINADVGEYEKSNNSVLDIIKGAVNVLKRS